MPLKVTGQGTNLCWLKERTKWMENMHWFWSPLKTLKKTMLITKLPQKFYFHLPQPKRVSKKTRNIKIEAGDKTCVSYSNSSHLYFLTYCASANTGVAVKYTVVSCLLWSLLFRFSSVNVRLYGFLKRVFTLWCGEGLPLCLSGLIMPWVGWEQAELFFCFHNDICTDCVLWWWLSSPTGYGFQGN